MKKALFIIILSISITESLVMILLSQIHFEKLEPWLSALFDATVVSLVAIVIVNRMVKQSIIGIRGNGESEWSQLKIGAIVFAFEAIVMLTLHQISSTLSTWQETLIDVSLLTIGTSLVIYAIVLKPASNENAIIKKSEFRFDPIITTNVFAYLCFMILLAMIMVSAYEQQDHQNKHELINKEARGLGLVKFAILNQLEHTALDCLTLASQTDIQEVFSGSPHAFTELQNDYLNIAKVKTYYKQIRLLDIKGIERIRIQRENGQPEITPANKLQNKSKRHYFRHGNKLLKGEIYISPLDLNKEYEKIENPHVPTIRVVSPVFGDNNEKLGIIVLNLNGHYFLNEIEKAQPETMGQLMLINEDGYWLYGGPPESQWSFMFTEKRGIHFQSIYPSIWKTMQQTSPNQISSHLGSFVIEKIQFNITQALNNPSLVQMHSNHKDHWPTWNLISFIPNSILNKKMVNTRNLMVLLYLVILVLVSIGTIIITRAMIKRRQAEKQVLHLAFYDSLTGLTNRSLYIEKLSLEIAHAHREQHILAVMYLDLDHFKPVNDKLGHEAGDAVLREVAKRLCQDLRSTDTIARLGGDEFAILLPNAGSKSEIAHIANRIIESIAKPFHPLGRPCHIGISIGIGILVDKDSPESLTRRADLAMYEAKDANRNCFRFASNNVANQEIYDQ